MPGTRDQQGSDGARDEPSQNDTMQHCHSGRPAGRARNPYPPMLKGGPRPTKWDSVRLPVFMGPGSSLREAPQ
jgi:hypothetical protein